MSIRGKLPAFSPYTFGTMSLGRKLDRFKEDIEVARTAMEAGVWFHTSQEYGGSGTFMILRHAFDQARQNLPKCIFKVRCDSAELIRFDVEDALRRLGIERVDVAQLCRDKHDKRDIVRDFLSQGPMWNTCCDLKEKGLVGNFAMELFASFSDDAAIAVENDMFDAYILYYNLLDRQASNALFALLQAKNCPLLALRTLGGGRTQRSRAASYEQSHPQESVLAHLDALEPLLRKSGCRGWDEFSMRFILSVPQVRTTIGGTSNTEHLKRLLELAWGSAPLQQEIVQEIQALHNEWAD